MVMVRPAHLGRVVECFWVSARSIYKTCGPVPVAVRPTARHTASVSESNCNTRFSHESRTGCLVTSRPIHKCFELSKSRAQHNTLGRHRVLSVLTSRTMATTSDSVSLTAKKIPKVELHVHLDGAMKASTIWELAKKKGISVPGNTLEEFKQHVKVSPEDMGDLPHFLEKFNIFMPPVAGDPEALRRIAYEWCEYAAEQNIVYSEIRYCPHLFASNFEKPTYSAPGDLTAKQVVEIINCALKEGCKDFNTKVRSLLCCMRHAPEWSQEILQLCEANKDQGVVGIDVASDETVTELDATAKEHVRVFQKAANLGINRTAHAGESGSADNVKEAVDLMHSQRIGHGYHTLEDPVLYKRLLEKQIHFEVCPYSSLATGSAILEGHPVHEFIKGGANFSLSTDDPLVTGLTLCEEYEFVINKMGLGWNDIIRANLNAAKSCFLPENEKKELLSTLEKQYQELFPEESNKQLKG